MGAHKRHNRRRSAGGGRRRKPPALTSSGSSGTASTGGDFECGGSLLESGSSATGSPRAVSEYDLGGGAQFVGEDREAETGGGAHGALSTRGCSVGSVKRAEVAGRTSLSQPQGNFGYMYHPRNPCSQSDGYAGRLTSSQEAAIGALRQWLTQESVDLTPLLGEGKGVMNGGASCVCPPENHDLALLRFLRRNAWDVEQTRTQLEKNLAWRMERDIATSLRRKPWEVAGCKDAETFDSLCRKYYPHYTLGGDRLGRPILVQKYGNFNTSKLRECTTLEGLLSYHAWEQEKNAELLRRTAVRTGVLVETYTLIMDLKGMGIGLVNRDFLWLFRVLSDMDRTYYPGRGGVTFVINTPPLFGLVWAGIRSFVENTQARVHIFSEEIEWKAALVEAIDPRQLPVEYGGSAPPLTETPFLPAVHQALEENRTMVGGRSIDDFVATAASPSTAGTIEGHNADVTLHCPSSLRCIGLDGNTRDCRRWNDGHVDSCTVHGHTNGANVSGSANGTNGGRGASSARGISMNGAKRMVIDSKVCTEFFHNRLVKGNKSGISRTNGAESLTNGKGGSNKANTGVDICQKSNGFGGGRAGGASGTDTEEAAVTAVTSPSANHAKTAGGSPSEDMDRGVFAWVLDVVPGGRLVAGVAATVAAATFGAVSHVGGHVFPYVTLHCPSSLRCIGLDGNSRDCRRWNDGHVDSCTVHGHTNGANVSTNGGRGASSARGISMNGAKRMVIDSKVCTEFFHNRLVKGNKSGIGRTTGAESLTNGKGGSNKANTGVDICQKSNGFGGGRAGGASGTDTEEAAVTAVTSPSANHAKTAGGSPSEDLDRGVFPWVLDVVPGGRLVAGVAATVAAATFGAVSHVGGHVFPGESRAAASEAFGVAKFLGGWTVG